MAPKTRYVVTALRQRPHPRQRHKSFKEPPPSGKFPSDLSVPISCTWRPSVTICGYVTAGVHEASSQGGPVLDGTRLELLFWGDFWRTNESLVTELTQAVSDILASPYLSELSQYGVNSISQGGSTIVISPGPPFPSFTSGDATDMVWALIDDGKFGESQNILYMIFGPNGTAFEGDDAGGAHTVAIDPDIYEDAVDVVGMNLPVARVAWVNFAPTIDAMTSVFSHELVEALTDPDTWLHPGVLADASGLGATRSRMSVSSTDGDIDTAPGLERRVVLTVRILN